MPRIVRSVEVFLLVLLACGFVAGCGPQAVGPACKPSAQPSPRTQRAASAAPLSPLAVRALLKVDELAPEISKPKNPVAADKLSDEIQPIVAQAKKHLADRKFDLAVNLLERALARGLDHPRIRRSLAFAYFDLANRDKAKENFLLSAKVVPDDLELQLLGGKIFASLGHNDRAIAYFRTALKCSQAKDNSPDTAQAMLMLCKLLTREGYWTAALQCYETLDKWISKHGRAYAASDMLRPLVLDGKRLLFVRGQLLMLLRRYPEAAGLFKQAYYRDRTDILAGKFMIDAMVSAGNFARGEEMLIEIIDEPAQRFHVPKILVGFIDASGDKEIILRLWKAHLSGKRIDDRFAISLIALARRLGCDNYAAVIAESLLRSRPDNIIAAGILSDIYFRSNQSNRAVDLWRKLHQAQPDKTSITLRYILSLMRVGQIKKAADELDRIPEKNVKLSASDAKILRWCRLCLVKMMIGRGDYDQAIGRIKKYLKMNSKDAELLCVMSECLTVLGRTPEAIEVLERALKFKPDDPGLNNNLGYFYAVEGIKLDKAERMIRKALVSLKSVQFLDSLGWVFYKQGRFDEADRIFRQVLVRLGSRRGHPVIYDHIGDTRYRLGKTDRALEQWRLAVALAETGKFKGSEIKLLLKHTPGKIKAVLAGKIPLTAPPGRSAREKIPSTNPMQN